tara:strand:+ start:289 stop:825 length:537 start_codon:yes stop_codon:yes gene_type:complete
MPENTSLIVICTILGLLLVGVIAYFVMRFLRGSIKLTMPQTSFGAGQMISGSFDLMTKKSIQGNQLFVTLRGVKETKIRDGEKTRTRRDEIYCDQVTLEDAREYPAGYSAKYDFQISTPNVQSPEFMNSGIGQALVSAFRLLSDRRTRIKWRVEARLDAKGIDLAASKSVQLNLGQFH